jgi:hypothetical protein
MKPVFLLTQTQLSELPSRERDWFRPAVTNESIKNARIETDQFVFYPYDRQGLAVTTEAQLRKLVPTYFKQFLRPEQSRLERRANIVRAKRSDWWGLSERRAWALDSDPRIVSKYFGGPGGFALDLMARFIVVQGFAWFLKQYPGKDTTAPHDDAKDLPVTDVLAAYVAVMNSHPFRRLLEIFSPHVAGGQFDLSPRYVNAIPIPDVYALSGDEISGQLVSRLAAFGNSPRMTDVDWQVGLIV